MHYSGRVFGGGGGFLWEVLAFMFVSFFESFIKFFKSIQFIDIFKTKLRPLGVLMLLAFLISFNTAAHATDGVPTTITNADKFQFQGALVVSNKSSDAAIQVRQVTVPLSIQTKTLDACQASVDAACTATLYGVGITSKITTSWLTENYCVALGKCLAK